MNPILSKARMYEHLENGSFGNTIPQWFDLDKWAASDDAAKYEMWAVRSQIVGGPCRLFCPRTEVIPTAAHFECPVNVSVMIDVILDVTLWADIYDSDTGISVYGIENPPKGGSWRGLMPSQGREWRGLAAQLVLRKHLNANSLADMQAVFDTWPGHVLELSACNRCYGTTPGRNAVVWEVRGF